MKAVQIGPVWRAERPQKGRFRQFTQCDIDILGQRSWVAEVELILATTEALSALGMQGLTVRINDRRILVALAKRCGFEPSRYDSVFIALDKLDKIDWPGVVKELTGAGHPPAAIARLQGLFTGHDPAAASARAWKRCGSRWAARGDGGFDALSMVFRTLDREAGGSWRLDFDPTLVRGMSYYTGPIFEVASAEFSSSIAGGGRYDELIGKILGQDVPATGFSIGFERVILLLMDRLDRAGGARKRIALIFEEDKDDLATVLVAARALRADGLAVSTELRARKLGGQLAALSAQGFDGFALFDGTPRPSIRRFSDLSGTDRRGTATAHLSHAHLRWIAARARRPHRPAVGLGPPQARPRQSALHRPPRPLRHHPVRARLLEPRFTMAEGLRPESVITVTGRVAARAPDTVNPKLATGEVEVAVEELAVQSAAEPLPHPGQPRRGLPGGDAAPVPVPRPPPRAAASQHRAALAGHRQHPPADDRRRASTSSRRRS